MNRPPIGAPGRLTLVLAGAGAVASALVLTYAAHTDEPRRAAPPAAPAAGAADAPAKAAPSRIAQVTVYPDSALVTREVEVPEGAGSFELVVTPLPEHTVNSSLYSEGADGIRVLTTRFRTRPVKEDTREEVRKLEDEARKLQDAAQKLQADLGASQQNMALVGKLENFTAASTQNATEKGKLDSDATIALAKYLMEGRTEKSKEAVAIQQQLRVNAEQTEFVQRKLREASAGTSKTERDAVIVVDKAAAGPGRVRLNYLVNAAAWRPQYKLRAGKGAKDPVQLEYLAAIMQQTGEDWQNVGLRLSTAQPMLNASPPELKMLAVAVVPRGAVNPALAGGGGRGGPSVPMPPGMGQMGMGQMGNFGALGGGFARNGPGGQPGMPGSGFGGGGFQGNGMQQQLADNFTNSAIPNPTGLATAGELDQAVRNLRLAAQSEQNQKKEAGANEIFNYAGALEQARDIALNADDSGKAPAKQPAPRAPKNEGPSVTYPLNAKLTVPSRNDEQVLEVARIEMAPEYFYKAVPVLTPHVYREANLTNKSAYVLLPGEATMYNGADFVGRMNLPLVAIGEQFTAGFGTEPQLQVQRQMVDKSRAMQGGNQILKYEYRILASSYKPERVRLQVWDRLPQAENETMGVSLVKASPDVSKDALYLREERPHNLLRWDLEIDPEMNGEKAQTVQYEFKLELDRQMTFGSFQSK